MAAPTPTRFTVDQGWFYATLFAGLGVVAWQGEKFFNTTPGDELWDGTTITGVAYFGGVLGLLLCLRNLVVLKQQEVDLLNGKGLWQTHALRVRRTNAVSTTPTLDLAMSWTATDIYGLFRVTRFLGAKLPAVGIGGTLYQTVAAFGGFERVVSSVTADATGVDVSGMSYALVSMQAAFISSIVALFFAVWISGLNHFMEGEAKRLVQLIEWLSVKRELADVKNQPSGEAAQISDLALVMQERPNLLKFREPIEDAIAEAAEGIIKLAKRVERSNAAEWEEGRDDDAADDDDGLSVVGGI